MMEGSEVRTAFVSTNSITQGEQVAYVWAELYKQFDIHIDFAHRTFVWGSEAKLKAAVHCVIIGFSTSMSSGLRKRLMSITGFKAYKEWNKENFCEFITDYGFTVVKVNLVDGGLAPVGVLIAKKTNY